MSKGKGLCRLNSCKTINNDPHDNGIFFGLGLGSWVNAVIIPFYGWAKWGKERARHIPGPIWWGSGRGHCFHHRTRTFSMGLLHGLYVERPPQGNQLASNFLGDLVLRGFWRACQCLMISSIIVSRVLLGDTGAFSVKWRNKYCQAAQPIVVVFLILFNFAEPSVSHLANGTKPQYPPQRAVVSVTPTEPGAF